jgi:phospholipid-binding lipoprotein MlaA
MATDTAAAGLAMGPPVMLVEDRFEGFNRSMYRFNFEFDQYVYLPIVRGYRFVVPRPVRTGISNFFSNLGEIRNASNGVLQARPEVASRATIRFVVNSTIGVLGFFDVATRLGVDQQREDFGQTLGWWGVGPGPYLVLPILGPSSVRDASGVPVDFALGALAPPGAQVNDVVYATPAPYPLQAVDARETQPFRYYDSGSAFEYDLVRFLYFRAREAEVRR